VVARPAAAPGRMIHIRIPFEVHKLLRMKAAIEDTTIQDVVARLVAQGVGDVEQDAHSGPSHGEKKGRTRT